MTPEGRVKARVSKLLQGTDFLYYWMPVPSGYGATTLDYVGCHMGRFFSIETKTPGKKPTHRQTICIETMIAAGAKVFVIDGENGQYEELERWLNG